MTAIDTHDPPTNAPAGWLIAGGVLVAALSVTIVTYRGTVESAVHLWLTRDTYSYAFAVLPIAGFLLWLNRGFIAQLAPSPTLGGALVAFAFSALWFAGAKLEILEVQHLAVPGIFIGLIVSAIGSLAATRLWLPLAYLFLLAPVGTPLLPFLQTVTASIATAILALGQIPFFAEGHNIEVATGKYVVAPGCAGLNFILAAVTVVPLFCEMMYSSLRKKMIAFAAMMALVPVANGIRVFGIIAIAEYSHRALDIAADHLLYGWLFFSFVLLLMFFVASRYADPVRSRLPAMRWPAAASLNEFLSTPVFVRLAVTVSTATVAACLAPVLHILAPRV